MTKMMIITQIYSRAHSEADLLSLATARDLATLVWRFARSSDMRRRFSTYSSLSSCAACSSFFTSSPSSPPPTTSMTGLKLTCFLRLCGVEADAFLLDECDFFKHDFSSGVDLGVAVVGVLDPVVDFDGVDGDDAIATFFIPRTVYVFNTFE